MAIVHIVHRYSASFMSSSIVEDDRINNLTDIQIGHEVDNLTTSMDDLAFEQLVIEESH